MAVPILTTVTPSTGPTKGGNLVKLTGTNFRVPVVPATGYLGGDAQRTIEVKFEGVVSPWAHAISATIAYARVPEWRGAYDTFPLALDVRLANLDDSEVEIAGENVTLADGYTIDQPDLKAETDFQRVIRELVRLFRRHLLRNVWLTVSRDYSDNPSAADETLRATVPLVHLHGPRTMENREYAVNQLDEIGDSIDPNMWLRYKEPLTVDLEFDIVGWAQTARELTSLGQALSLMFRDVKWVTIDIDPGDPTKGEASYELDMRFADQPDYDTAPALDDLRNFRASCIIRGVDIDERVGTIVERGWDLYAGDGEVIVESEAVAGPTDPPGVLPTIWT